MSTPTNAQDLNREIRLDPARATLLLQISGALAVIGIILAGVAWASDPERFGFSYLTGFSFVVTLGLGGLFFVLLQHVTKAGWSVAPRRTMEWLSGVLPLCIVLFIPIALLAGTIFHDWMHPEKARLGEEGLKTLKMKSAYLNPPFFYIRAVIYFIAWTALSMIYRNASREQDVTGNPELTKKLQRWSGPALYVFGFSLTFAMFDWLMSLNPLWYSTIFGVYIFSGATTGSLGLLALITLALQENGLGSRISNVEHRHDIGKLLFGFIVFWAYIAFAQFFLIWYANMPDETQFFKMRWNNTWEPVSLAILFGHFWIPFLVLLSRHAKRSAIGLGIGATIMVVMHYVDMYWLVMPNLDREIHLSWIDFAGFLAPVGVLAWWLALRASRDPVYPVRDPRMGEAAQMMNL